MPGRRILQISDVFLPMLFGAGDHHYSVVRDHMPADCRVLAADMEFPYLQGCNTVRLLLESDEWEPTADGEPYPHLHPHFSPRSSVVPPGSASWPAAGKWVPLETK